MAEEGELVRGAGRACSPPSAAGQAFCGGQTPASPPGATSAFLCALPLPICARAESQGLCRADQPELPLGATGEVTGMHRQRSEGASEAGSLPCGQGCPFSRSSGCERAGAGHGDPVSPMPGEGVPSAGGWSGKLCPKFGNICNTALAVGGGGEAVPGGWPLGTVSATSALCWGTGCGSGSADPARPAWTCHFSFLSLHVYMKCTW